MSTLVQLACIFALLVAQCAALYAQDRQGVEQAFSTWLESDMQAEASRRGVSRTAFNRALGEIRLIWELPDLVPPGSRPPRHRSQNQAEFRSPGKYFAEQHLSGLAVAGRALAKRHKALLDRVEQRYRVPGRIILAIWGRESAFGRATTQYSVLSVLATNAFMSHRKELFKQEFFAALEMVERGVTPARMKGSRAGAMGQPQFLPSSYLQHAVDFDGDGKPNIWTSVPDTLASIANYLAQFGWIANRDWGYEVTIPRQLSCAQEGPNRQASIRDWAAKGIARISGKAFLERELSKPAMMMVPAGRHGPAFLVTPNFYVLKEYNNSDLYALFVGNLADRIAYNLNAFRGSWRRIDPMLRSQVQYLQERLQAKGYDVGGADGLPGYKTRRSIGDYEKRTGLAQTCFPSRRLLDHFARQ